MTIILAQGVESFTTVLMNNGAGMAALLFVFWMLFKEMPEQRNSREKMMTQFGVEAEKERKAREQLVVSFREELSTERHECAKERVLDREARHATANATQTVGMAVKDLADVIEKQEEILKELVKPKT